MGREKKSRSQTSLQRKAEIKLESPYLEQHSCLGCMITRLGSCKAEKHPF